MASDSEREGVILGVTYNRKLGVTLHIFNEGVYSIDSDLLSNLGMSEL